MCSQACMTLVWSMASQTLTFTPSPGGLIRCKFQFSRSGASLRVSDSNELPGKADAAGPGTTLRSARVQDNKWHLHKAATQFSSVTQSCPTLHDPMNRSMPGLSVHLVNNYKENRQDFRESSSDSLLLHCDKIYRN